MAVHGAPVVVGLGEILWDLLPGRKQLGGAPANFAFHAKALGGRTSVISRIGDDELGREILGCLDGWGIGRAALSVDPGHPTGTVSVSVDANGIPQYVIQEGVAWDFIQDSQAGQALMQAADAVCFGSLCQRSPASRGAIGRLLAGARPDCLKVFDINLRNTGPGPDVILGSLESANVVKLSDEELPLVAAMAGVSATPVVALSELAERFELRAVALTRGSHGSLLYSRGVFADHPGRAADIVDTVGAGDAFTAALTIGLLRHDPVDAISERANRLAAAVCSRSGGTPDLSGMIVDWTMPSR